MADFILVADAGQGSWWWGRVWGHLTAPVESPPRLYARSSIGKVVAVDLPRDGPRLREERPALTLDDFVSAIAGEVQAQSLEDVIMAGHGVAAPILLQAAAQLKVPPKRIVLFAGIIPDEGKAPLDMLPRVNRLGFKMMARMTSVAKKDFKLPKAVITNVYCNGMDPFDVIQIVGRFGPLPLQLFRSRVYLNDLSRGYPVTYVPLRRDKLLPHELQRRMAARIEGVEIVGELDACHEVMIERPREVADILRSYA